MYAHFSSHFSQQIFIHIEHTFCICPFLVAFFSATIDGRDLIFGHKLQIGTPYRGKCFFDPSDSYFLFAEERGYHKWALAHSSSYSCLVIRKMCPSGATWLAASALKKSKKASCSSIKGVSLSSHWSNLLFPWYSWKNCSFGIKQQSLTHSTYVIGAYHLYSCEFVSHPWQSLLDTNVHVQLYVIKFVSNLMQVDGFPMGNCTLVGFIDFLQVEAASVV